MRKFLATIYFSLVCGALSGAAALVIGFSHNIQGEFVNVGSGEIDIGYSVLIFSSWFLLVFLVTLMLGGILTLFWRLFFSAERRSQGR